MSASANYFSPRTEILHKHFGGPSDLPRPACYHRFKVSPSGLREHFCGPSPKRHTAPSAAEIAALRLQVVDNGWNVVPSSPRDKKCYVVGWSDY
jgi:hypothetical protein